MNKKFLVVFLVSTVLLFSVFAAPDSVKFKRIIVDASTVASLQELESKGCKAIHKLKDMSALSCPESALQGLKWREDRVFHLLDLNADRQINADDVWAQGVDGTGSKAVILDTGVDYTNAELADSYLGGYDFVNGDSDPADDHGHGTHVAGIITANGNDANAKGVAPKAGFYMLKVCDPSGWCYESDMVAAMDYVVYSLDAKVMSISIGGLNYDSDCDYDPLAAKVNWVVDHGVTAVVAAGNNGLGVSTPACASKAIAVGAVDSSNTVPWWSDRSPSLDLVAPGVAIYSTYLGGYATASGTSMATPHVSGVAALLLQTNPSLTVSELRTALLNNTNPASACYQCFVFSPDGGCSSQGQVSCTASITGKGVVDAYKAYLSVKPAPGCTSDAQCSDGVYCNGTEKCLSGVCQPGVVVNCSSFANQCNTGVCDEANDRCIAQPKANGTSCSDGLYCNIGEKCWGGVCSRGSARVCASDNKSCTTDRCNEALDKCEYVWPACGLLDGCCGPSCSFSTDGDCKGTKCWSSTYKYLLNATNQEKKFCRCAQGTYNYLDYSYIIAKNSTVYYYTNAANNTNWNVTSKASNVPVTSVRCVDGVNYFTNRDYFR